MSNLGFILLLVVVPATFADIVELDDGMFSEKIIHGANSDVWFVKFYQPWCGFCNKMQPDWEKANADFHVVSELNSEQNRNVHFGQLDCGKCPYTCDRLGIYGYPKLILFVNNTMYDYPRDLDRSSENFVNFAKDGYLQQSSRSIPSGISWIEAVRKELETVWYNCKFILFRYPEVAVCFVALGIFVGIATTLALIMTINSRTVLKEKMQ